jgi:hypothetical protein
MKLKKQNKKLRREVIKLMNKKYKKTTRILEGMPERIIPDPCTLTPDPCSLTPEQTDEAINLVDLYTTPNIDIDLAESNPDPCSLNPDPCTPPTEYVSIYTALQILAESRRRGIENLDYAIEHMKIQLWKEVTVRDAYMRHPQKSQPQKTQPEN